MAITTVKVTIDGQEHALTYSGSQMDQLAEMEES